MFRFNWKGGQHHLEWRTLLLVLDGLDEAPESDEHAALENWLRHQDHRAVLLRQAGVLPDDDGLPELLEPIYQARGRPQVDAGADT